MKGQEVYLKDILDCIEKIEKYIGNLSEMEFVEDDSVQDAVMRRLEIVGEAVKHLSPEIKSGHPEIPWKDVAGMRDILIHEYAGVQIERVWKTAKNDLPPLKLAILKLIEKDKP